MPIVWDEPQPGGASAGGVLDAAARAFSAGADQESMDTMRAETGRMVQSAKSGGFRISEQGAQPLREALAEMQKRVDEVYGRLTQYFAQEPALGGQDYARRVAAHQHGAATREPGSVLVVLKDLRKVLADADMALEIAVEKYKEAEGSASAAFKAGQD